jgi:hypothetical protein
MSAAAGMCGTQQVGARRSATGHGERNSMRANFSRCSPHERKVAGDLKHFQGRSEHSRERMLLARKIESMVVVALLRYR